MAQHETTERAELEAPEAAVTPLEPAGTAERAQPGPPGCPLGRDWELPSRLLERMGDAFFAVDRAWCFTFLNSRAEQVWRALSGKPRELLLGRSFWEELPAVAGTQLEQELRRAMAEQRTLAFETFFAPLDGWYALHVYPSPDGLAVYLQDVTGRRRAEEALRESEERLRLALEAAQVGIWDWDLRSGRVVWSGAMERLFGFAPGTFPGTISAVRQRIHPEDRAGVERARARTVEAGSEFVLEYRVLWPDSSVHWVASQGRALRNSAGQVVRLVGTAMDVTERKQAERGRQVLVQMERLRALGQMASGVAHDLNQSLALMAGYSDLIRQALAEPTIDRAQVLEMIDIIARAAADGGQTVSRLLTFVRTTPQDQAERVDLGELLREVAQLTAPRWRDAAQAEGRPIELTVASEGDTSITGRPSSLREAITNLIFNAVDALPTGGTIHLAAWRRGAQVVVEVADSGIGMSPEVQAKAFEPFFTTKGEHGTGLGLATVFGIVRQHDGKVSLTSTPGKGTTCSLYFPAAQSLPPRLSGQTPPDGGTPQPLRILAVDDEPALTRMAALMLQQHGHTVVTAASGEEAVARLEAEHFDLVLSDVGMGAGMNGWELAQLVRQRWPETRFALATGWGAAIDPAQARARGVDAVLAKPYRSADLLSVCAAAGRGG